jgi:hypothetical protein
MHSAVLQTIQYLEATGHGLAEGATPLEQEHYLDRVKSWARVLMVNRLLFGFSAPAAPELQLDPDHLHVEFRKLLGELPIEEAQKEFIRRHPDANAYTVFQSKSTAGAPLPATEKAVRFMEDHAEFLRDYPEAGAWFLPQDPDEGYSPAAYREQLALEMRKRKTTDEFMRDLKFSDASGDYFDTRDARDEALAAAGTNAALKRQVRQQWSDFSKPYLKMHPVFAEELQSPEGSIRRERALTQLRTAMADPRLPATPQGAAIRDLVDTYDAYEQARVPYASRTDSAATRAKQQMKSQFVTWAKSYTQEHPEIAGLYDRVFRMEVGDG